MWKVTLISDAKQDLYKIDNSMKKQVMTGIRKVSQKPLPKSEGGYGNPLGKANGLNLTGYFKIKYKRLGIRVVYTLNRQEKEMIIIVISARADNQCYDEENKRKGKF